MLAAHVLTLGLLVGQAWRTPLLSPSARIRLHCHPIGLAQPLDIDKIEVEADADGVLRTETFATIGLMVPGVLENLAAANMTIPNALQRASFSPIASARDVILHACTGSGKTLAFLLPLIQQLDPNSREPQALVLCPSRELAFQTLRVAEKLLKGSPLRVVAVAGGVNPARQIEKIRKEKPQLLVGTAGRVRELTLEWRKLKLQRVRHLVIDEVDEALRGANLEASLALIGLFQDGRPLQILFASATADNPTVRRAAVQLLHQPLMLRLMQKGGSSSSRDVPELPQTLRHVVYVLPTQKHLEAIRKLAHSAPAPTCLIFVNSPHRARIVCDKLSKDYGVPAEPLYGKQEREEKVNVMRRLLDGRLRFVVTTEMGARGLDIPSLTHVVNLEMPTDSEHYVHRAGRTGRAGAEGTVISVVSPERSFVVEKLTAKLGEWALC